MVPTWTEKNWKTWKNWKTFSSQGKFRGNLLVRKCGNHEQDYEIRLDEIFKRYHCRTKTNHWFCDRAPHDN